MSEGGREKVLVEPEIARVGEIYAELIKELRRLNEELEHGRPEAEVCLDAVIAIKRFFDADESVFAQGLTRPLAMLSTAFRDLLAGFSPKLFKKPEGVKIRPAGASKTVAIQGVAAASVELLHRCGMSFEDASSFVVGQLKKVGITSTGGSRHITNKTVLGWRDEMGSRNTAEANDIYRSFCRGFGEYLDSEIGNHASLDHVKAAIMGFMHGLVSEGVTSPPPKKSD